MSVILDVEDLISIEYNLEVFLFGMDRLFFKEKYYVDLIGEIV